MTGPSSPRDRLRTIVAPGGNHPTTITLSLPFSGGELTVEYAPERYLLDRESFKDYLKVVPGAAVEQLVATIVDYLANEIVAKSLRVTFATDDAGAKYTVAMDDAPNTWLTKAINQGRDRS
jgi:NADPH-dependent 7-cyano-7-deazaguanine reductase QueF